MESSTINNNTTLIQDCKKAKYASKQYAEFAIKQIQKKNLERNSPEKKRPIDCYLCEICNSWHLTSKESYSSLRFQILSITEEKEKQIAAITKERDEWKKKYEESMGQGKLNTKEKSILKSYREKIKSLENTINELHGKINVIKFEQKGQKTNDEQLEKLKRDNVSMKTKLEKIKNLL